MPPAGASPKQSQQPARVVVPERPKLAPGVRLVGQMQESAFDDPPWLIDRQDVGYVQVTRALHHIAEHCNGENTLEEIAAKASEASGQKLGTESVGRLIGGILIPKGVVAMADGSSAPVAKAAAPLQLNLRMKMLQPHMIDPATRIFQFLYWPPVLIVVLAAAAMAQAWLYLVHGVGSSVHNLLYTPGLMLVVLAAIILSAGFHEFGHAAALRYGGGRVKGMGVGLYLVYPAFYTDVSDNYRLPRWARVRTDLGGFYFNLIFALGVMGLYALTGHEFLLILVLLMNLEIIHQLIPLVRLDGYWTLVDMTGLPDFFAYMAAFAGSVLPIPGWKELKLPPIKPWAKVVLGLYTIVTVPLLALVLFMMVQSVPRVLATAWDSFLHQASDFSMAQSGGDVLGMAAASAQVLLLALPTVGLAWTLFNLGRTAARLVWSWSKPTPLRRAIGAIGTLGALGLVVMLWAPQLPFGAGAPGPLYERTQKQFQPIAPEERGTVPEAVGAPPLERLGPLPNQIPARQPTPATTGTPGAQGTPGATSAPGTPGTGGTPGTPRTSSTSQATPARGAPTAAPTASSRGAPTAVPRGVPAAAPTTAPTAARTSAATERPTSAASAVPTTAATAAPTVGQRSSGTPVGTAAPTAGPQAAGTSAPRTQATAAPRTGGTSEATVSPPQFR
jgi:putative peptide zinc metalloprotease protein